MLNEVTLTELVNSSISYSSVSKLYKLINSYFSSFILSMNTFYISRNWRHWWQYCGPERRVWEIHQRHGRAASVCKHAGEPRSTETPTTSLWCRAETDRRKETVSFSCFSFIKQRVNLMICLPICKTYHYYMSIQ